MPRFVILQHDHPFLHWDLMLECGLILRSWRLAAPLAPGKPIAATAVLDHRLRYLDYEGPICGARGTVVRWDRGTFTAQVQGEKSILVQLEGERVQGVLRLEQIAGDAWSGELREEQAAS